MLTHWKRLWCWEGLGAGGEGDDRQWDGWMASLTRWTWVWVNSGSWWWTGRPGVLRFMGLQRVRHDWVTELNYRLGNCSLDPMKLRQWNTKQEAERKLHLWKKASALVQRNWGTNDTENFLCSDEKDVSQIFTWILLLITHQVYKIAFKINLVKKRES